MSESEPPKLIWSCPTARGAYALCVDQDTGVVYVTGPDHMLYIISAGVCAFGKIVADTMFSAVMFLRAFITVSLVS